MHSFINFKKVAHIDDLRDITWQALGEAAAVFMGDPNGGKIVMPTEKLEGIADKTIKRIQNDKAIGVDFDNTIFKPIKGDRYCGCLNETVADTIREAKEMGYRIIIWSARITNCPSDISFIEEFLTENNVPFDEITPIKKPEVELIIDDKAIRPSELEAINETSIESID